MIQPPQPYQRTREAVALTLVGLAVIALFSGHRLIGAVLALLCIVAAAIAAPEPTSPLFSTADPDRFPPGAEWRTYTITHLRPTGGGTHIVYGRPTIRSGRVR